MNKENAGLDETETSNEAGEPRFILALYHGPAPTQILKDAKTGDFVNMEAICRELNERRPPSKEREQLNVEEMRQNLHATFNGGYKTPEEAEIFHHGMDTVCNVLKGRAKGENTNGIFPQHDAELRAALNEGRQG